MYSVFSDPWVQILIAWGTGPLVTTLMGFYQWARDRRDRQDQHRVEESSDALKDRQDFIKTLQDECVALRADRDRLDRHVEELKDENAALREHYMEARNAYGAAKHVGSVIALHGNQPQPIWPPLMEFDL